MKKTNLLWIIAVFFILHIIVVRANDACSFCDAPLEESKLYAGTSQAGKIYVFDGSTWSLSQDTSETRIYSLGKFNNELYAGTSDSGLILKKAGSWSTSFDTPEQYVKILCEYNDKFYAGSQPNGKVYSFDGSTWSLIHSSTEAYLRSFAVYNNKLYMGTEYNGIIYVFDGSAWSTAFDTPEAGVLSLSVYNGKLYATTGATSGSTGKVYSFDGTAWTMILDTGEQHVYASEVYNGKLYIGTYPNGKILAYDGTSWTTSFDSPESWIIALKTFKGKLYAGTSTNGRIYVFDGSTWSLSFDSPEASILSLDSDCASLPPTTTTSTSTTTTSTTTTSTTIPPTTTSTTTTSTTTTSTTTTSTTTTSTTTTSTTIPCVPSCQGGGDVTCWDDPDALQTRCIGNSPVQTEFKCDFRDRKGTWECVDSDTRMRSGTDYYVDPNTCTCVSQPHSQTENCLPGTQCEDGECVPACDGFINLEIDDDRVCPRDRITLRAHGMINCDRKLVSFRLGSCDGQELTRCILRNGECERKILSPKTIGPTEVYACIDKNMDSDFLDEGEQDFKSLNIDCNECPTNTRCRVAGCNFCAKCGGFCNSNVNQFDADRCLNPWETCDRTCVIGECGATNCTAPSSYVPEYHIGSFQNKICRR